MPLSAVHKNPSIGPVLLLTWPTTWPEALIAVAQAYWNPGRLPRSVKPAAAVQRKAIPLISSQDVPTTWPASLTPVAKPLLSIAPRSDIPAPLLHRKEWTTPTLFVSWPTIWPAPLIPKASLELKVSDAWMSVSPTPLVHTNA